MRVNVVNQPFLRGNRQLLRYLFINQIVNMVKQADLSVVYVRKLLKWNIASRKLITNQLMQSRVL